MEPIRIDPLGDAAFLAHFDDEKDARDWAAAVRAKIQPQLRDVVLAYRSVAVFPDPDSTNFPELESQLRSLTVSSEPLSPGRRLLIPVLYNGPDLEPVATRLGLTASEVVATHSSVDYDVFAVGFRPGFPYAGYLPQALCGLARRDSPRLRVPAGSVAIAGRQTAIYPQQSPGGWHLLGTTPLCIADIETGYFPISSGDHIRFHPITAAEFEARQNERF